MKKAQAWLHRKSCTGIVRGFTTLHFNRAGTENSLARDGRLRVIAKQSVTYWFNRGKLDNLLAHYVGVLEGCELLYAIDQSGQQVSSNIHPGEIDACSFGQDLSSRPYSVSLSVLKDVAFGGAFACEEYVSRETQRTCVTVMYGVTSGESRMGFIAADFYPAVT